jgi:hypothetical protein
MLFDINRKKNLEMILKDDPKSFIEALFKDINLPFTLTLLTNTDNEAERIVIRRKKTGQPETTETFPNLEWPGQVYSLSHVALPFRPDDPLYGSDISVDSPGIQLGSLSLRGERDILHIPASTMLRLRWNPFYDYMENNLLEFLRLSETESIHIKKRN